MAHQGSSISQADGRGSDPPSVGSSRAAGGAPAREPTPSSPHQGSGEHAHHGHGHGHGAGSGGNALSWALGVTLAYAAVEFAVGLYSGSLTLVADSGHMLSDGGALGLALIAQAWARKPRSPTATYGYRRAEVLAAFVNGVALAVVALLVLKEAVVRWFTPVHVEAGLALFCAALGLLLNLGVAWILHRDSRSHDSNLNLKAALAHVMSDALGSFAAILSSLLILGFGLYRADAVLSVLIAGLVAYSGWRVLRDTSFVLLESVPPGVSTAEVERAILACEGVLGCHDLHVWRISSGFDAITVHVTLKPGAHGVEVSRSVSVRISELFGIQHVTVQPEAAPPSELVLLRQSREGPAVHR